MGTSFYGGFSGLPFLATAALAATVQTFITSTTSNGYMSTGITGRGIALHIFCGGIYGIHSITYFFN